MTRKILLFAIPCLFIAVAISGCGVAKTGKAVVDDQLSQFEQYLNDKTVLPRANGQLKEAKQSRANLQELAQQRRAEVEVIKQRIQRLEEEGAKSRKAFETVQEAAKAAGLPKLSEATDADKDKQIQIAGQNRTGSDVYKLLQTYKDEVRKVDENIGRQKTRQTFLSGQANTVETQLRSIDNHIDSLERQIEDYKMYQDLLKAHQTIADLQIPSGQIEQILNTGNIITELEELNIKSGFIIKQNDAATDAGDLKDIIVSETGTFSITGDDLL